MAYDGEVEKFIVPAEPAVNKMGLMKLWIDDCAYDVSDVQMSNHSPLKPIDFDLEAVTGTVGIYIMPDTHCGAELKSLKASGKVEITGELFAYFNDLALPAMRAVEPETYDDVPHKDIKKVLRKARGLVARGWVQDEFVEKSWFGLRTRYCMEGALNVASGLGAEPMSFSRLNLAAIAAMQSYLGWNIPSWNDCPNRTKREVLKAFDGCIASL